MNEMSTRPGASTSGRGRGRPKGSKAKADKKTKSGMKKVVEVPEIDYIYQHQLASDDEKTQMWYEVFWKGKTHWDMSWVSNDDPALQPMHTKTYWADVLRSRTESRRAPLETVVRNALAKLDINEMDGYKVADVVTRREEALGKYVVNINLVADPVVVKVNMLKACGQLAAEWNRVIEQRGEYPIGIENIVDLAFPPSDFEYITERRPVPGVVIDKTKLDRFCLCAGTVAKIEPQEDPSNVIADETEKTAESEAPSTSKRRKSTAKLNAKPKRKTIRHRCCNVAYGRPAHGYKSLTTQALDDGQPIYECNRRCGCDDTCVNRVVQLGRRVTLIIFRTGNMSGWGVRAQHDIPKGVFVTEYVGELLTCEEGRQRTHTEYALDLSVQDGACYTLDAHAYGNLSRFINHSCEPNLVQFSVYTECQDEDMPLCALFTNRLVTQGEELCFDYNPISEETQQSPKQVVRDGEGLTEEMNECRCGTKSCRGKVFGFV